MVLKEDTFHLFFNITYLQLRSFLALQVVEVVVELQPQELEEEGVEVLGQEVEVVEEGVG